MNLDKLYQASYSELKVPGSYAGEKKEEERGCEGTGKKRQNILNEFHFPKV